MARPRRHPADQDEVAAALHASLAKVTRQLRHIDLPKGLTPERLRTLATICAREPISVGALAESEQVRPATISRMISSLESDGLVKRRGDKDDKRGVLVSSTAKGRQLYLRANRQYLSHFSEALSKLEPGQIELLRKLASLLEELNTALTP